MNRRKVTGSRLLLPLLLILCLVPGTLGIGGRAFIAHAATPKITVTPTSVAAGGTVTVSGKGWTPDEQVQFQLTMNGNPVGPTLNTSLTDGAGNFTSGAVTIPAGTPAGNYVLVAQGSVSNEQASTNLRVTTGAATISVSPTSVVAGGQIKASGTGLGPDEQVALLLESGATGSRQIGTVLTDGAGNFTSGAVTIPADMPAGSYSLVAQGIVSTKKASTNLAVTAGATTSISVSPSSVDAGGQVTVTGTGFGRDEQVQLQLAATGVSVNPLAVLPLTTVQTDGAGNLKSGSVTIPASTAGGAYQIIALGTASNKQATANLAVTSSTASITVKPTTFAPNDTITVTGTNFGRDEQVSIVLVSLSSQLAVGSTPPQVPLGKVLTNGAGNFGPVSLKVPFGVGGPSEVVATGGTSNRQASVNVTVNASAPTIVIAATTLIKPGDTINVTGKNFQPNENVTLSLVTLGTTTVLGTASAGNDGSFTTSPKIPLNASQGPATVVATGNSSRLSASAQLTIGAPAVNLTVSPTTVTAGNTVKVTGSGFVPGETVSVQISLNKAAPIGLATVIANTTGAFTIDALVIPATLAGGNYVMTAAGGSSGRTASANLTAQAAPANPVLSIYDPSHVAGQPYNLTPGGLATVSGGNFPANTQVLLTLTNGSSTINLATVATNGQGAFGPVGITIPASVAPGGYTMQAVVSGKSQASLPVKVVSLSPKLTLSTSVLKPGEKVTVTGIGYAPGEQVVLALNGAALGTSPDTILADSKGGFTASFTVPASINDGSNTLTGTGAASRASHSVIVQGQLPAAASYYFANGDTTSGTRTTISLLNTTGGAAKVDLTFLYADQPERTSTVTVPARSHLQVDLALVAGTGRHISTIVTSTARISAQSTIFYKGADNAITLGVQAPSTRWYEAEGYTGGSFKESLEIANPNTGYANVDVRFLPFNGKPPRDQRFTVPPRSNLNIDTSKYMPGLSFSMIITSDKGVVVDRTMRFGVDHRGATAGRGVTIDSTVWQFAQGVASSDRQTFLTILNPNQSSVATVTATFYDTKGKPVGNKTIIVEALRRGNIKLNDVLPNASVAMLVSSNVPVVVERPLYIGPANLDQTTSGADVFGSNGGGLTWLFPGGSLVNGNEDTYYFYNPALKENTITATFYTTTGKTVEQKTTVAPNSTKQLTVGGISAIAGQTYGVTFKSTNGQIFVVEQQSLNSAAKQLDATQGIAG